MRNHIANRLINAVVPDLSITYSSLIHSSQGNLHAHGRRGSAPLLRPEELMGGLRGGAERPDYHYLSLRRGSAPSQANQKGMLILFSILLLLLLLLL